MSKKKILFLVHLPPPVHGASLMNEMYLKSKIVNNIFCVKHIRLNYSKTVNDIGKITLMKLAGIFIVIVRIIHMLIFFRPGLVYFEIAPCGLGFLRDGLFALLCKMFRKKIIFHLQAKGVSDEVKNILKLWFYVLVFKNAKVILLSKLLYCDIEKVVRKENVYTLPNCVKNELTDEEFEKSLEERRGNTKPVLLFLSNMIESKGPLDVLELCKLLNADGIDFDCLFVGAWSNEGFKEKWYELLNQYNLQEKCKYLGAQYGDDKKTIMKTANFMILPTKYKLEAFSVVIIEAFMHGIPVLSYDNAAIKEIIKHDWLGYISFRKDYHDLYTYLKANIHKQFDSNKIRNHFLENYANHIVEQQLVNIFKQET
jgi:glycosyltransferase involved in cell wall biosynthesis